MSILQANDTYKVGTHVIIERSWHHNNNADTTGRSNTVVMCSRETNYRSYYVAIYVLLDEFKSCVPMIVVKGTPNSICVYGEDVQQIRNHVG